MKIRPLSFRAPSEHFWLNRQLRQRLASSCSPNCALRRRAQTSWRASTGLRALAARRIVALDHTVRTLAARNRLIRTNGKNSRKTESLKSPGRARLIKLWLLWQNAGTYSADWWQSVPETKLPSSVGRATLKRAALWRAKAERAKAEQAKAERAKAERATLNDTERDCSLCAH